MGVSQIERLLKSRGLSMHVHQCISSWVVWLYLAEEPALTSTGEGDELEQAIAEAIIEWDKTNNDDDAESEVPS